MLCSSIASCHDISISKQSLKGISGSKVEVGQSVACVSGKEENYYLLTGCSETTNTCSASSTDVLDMCYKQLISQCTELPALGHTVSDRSI